MDPLREFEAALLVEADEAVLESELRRLVLASLDLLWLIYVSVL